MTRHHILQTRLDDYADGLLGSDELRDIEMHLAGCDACRAEVEALHRLKARVAGLPREIAPSRDLWAGIAGRIGAPAAEVEPEPASEAEPEHDPKVIRVDFEQPRRRSAWVNRGLLAAAAIVLMVVSSTVTALMIRSRPGAPELVGNVQQTAPATQPASALVAFEPAEREFIETVDELVVVLDAQRDQLQPETVRTVEENLRIINRAIQEARAALEADPHNRDLTLMLSDVYKKKIDLLQSAVQMSSI